MKDNSATKIVFFGTSDFAIPALEKLLTDNWQIAAIITQPDRPVGRKQITTPPPIKEFAENNNLTVWQPEKLANYKTQIANCKPDLFVVADYGKIIPQSILDLAKFGCLNIHPSLLPKYRGPSPIETALLDGQDKTGVTIMLLDKEMDHGLILAQEKAKIGQEESKSRLEERLAQMGANLLAKVLPKFLDGGIKPEAQDHATATYTKILTREDGQIDWKKSAQEIYNQYRAFHPWPGIFTIWEDQRLKIIKPEMSAEHQSDKATGQVFLNSNNELSVNCGKGSLVLHEIQLEGKIIMNSKEFIRGYAAIVGTVLK